MTFAQELAMSLFLSFLDGAAAFCEQKNLLLDWNNSYQYEILILLAEDPVTTLQIPSWTLCKLLNAKTFPELVRS